MERVTFLYCFIAVMRHLNNLKGNILEIFARKRSQVILGARRETA